MLPVQVLEVDYEETVADPEGMARRLVAWCGLEWEPACLTFYEGKGPVRTASVVQVLFTAALLHPKSTRKKVPARHLLKAPQWYRPGGYRCRHD